jgi:hypothetical protein
MSRDQERDQGGAEDETKPEAAQTDHPTARTEPKPTPKMSPLADLRQPRDGVLAEDDLIHTAGARHAHGENGRPARPLRTWKRGVDEQAGPVSGVSR